MPVSSSYRPAPRHSALEGLYDEVAPARFPLHRLRFRNRRWDKRVGLGELSDAEWEAHFVRFEPLPSNLPKPLALRYHGHQFDVYNPNLGDGRGFLYAQLFDDARRLLDLGTKGSGTTPWSRGGDGRLTLKGGVREVLATEMLEALGVYTSKSFSLFETGEKLMRGDEPSPTRSSVLVRLSHSHIRFGTFQRLAYTDDAKGLERLLAYSIVEYYPELADQPDPSGAFLSKVARAAARQCAGTMIAGFVHGVLNSDNMSIMGESFDYGPYRFLPHYDPAFVAAYFDEVGLYAYGNQPRAMLRNVLRLATALRPIAPHLAAGPIAEEFETTLDHEATRLVVRRLGLASAGDVDSALFSAAFAFLAASRIGFDRFFFDLRGGLAREPFALAGPAASYYEGEAWDALRAVLETYAPLDPSEAVHPYFQRAEPCSLLIDEIESIWSAIADRDDWAPFCTKIESIREMGDAMNVPASG